MEAVNGQCVAVRLQMKLLNPSVAKHTLADYYEKENTNNIKKKSSNNSAMSLVTHLPSAAKPEKQSGEKKTSTKLPENAAYPVTSRPLFTILTWQPTPTRKRTILCGREKACNNSYNNSLAHFSLCCLFSPKR